MIPEISRTYHYLNPEVNEAIEKLYLNLKKLEKIKIKYKIKKNE